MQARLLESFYQRNPVTVARALLGQRLVRQEKGKRTAGIIVETEAYLGTKDQAAHTANGRRTARNESMWAAGGCAYVYFTYGMHYCMNVVAGKADEPVGVLIRALEPVEGIDLMGRRRLARQNKSSNHTDESKPTDGKILADTQLCSGPAKLCQALAIDRSFDGANLIDGRDLYIEMLRHRAHRGSDIRVGPRIGVDYAGPWATKPLRFSLGDNIHVSKPAS
jgi:DNA-3-methyladenine glycosylase